MNIGRNNRNRADEGCWGKMDSREEGRGLMFFLTDEDDYNFCDFLFELKKKNPTRTQRQRIYKSIFTAK